MWVEELAPPSVLERNEELRQHVVTTRPGTRAHAEAEAALMSAQRELYPPRYAASAVQVRQFPVAVPVTLVTLAVVLGGAAAVTARRENVAENGGLK